MAIIQPGPLVSATGWRSGQGLTDPGERAALLNRPAGGPVELVGLPAGAGLGASGALAASGGLPVLAPNLPSGYTVTTTQDWASLNSNSWGYTPRGPNGYIESVVDPDYAHAARFVYEPGFLAGNDPGAVHHYGNAGAAGVYVAFIYKFSANWVRQDPAMKFMHMMAAGWNFHMDPFHPNPGWPEQYGQNAGKWAFGPTGWGGTDDGLQDFTTTPFNNVNNAAATWNLDVWEQLEVQLVLSSTPGVSFDGIVRMWVNGVLTAEWTAVRTPAGAMDNVHFAGTWGGGSVPEVLVEQDFRLGATLVAIL
jgi:hypothetical protein